ncbi:MAG: ferrous iron transport protein B [Desulfobulbaceae bacterium A2]|uniref:Ferrous iron transport protein B n=1 Tax=Rhodoferax ferrireducens TaxID=192843 RepID=A0A1W9KP57_9BURK|nr:MAG: ferrous iron transport protein B [Rhodoferax ferrireducens]OQX18522.1 MAG: ferrous iron transport protein B [Desulfobulbaceae bacterium A2]
MALAGNPNSGKSTIFNKLTGAHQHVGNYPGVTVERKDGRCTLGKTTLFVTDLPGTYSLTAYSAEEVVARDILVREQPDVVVNIVDASNLERNLYLTVQLLELGLPLVLVFNMSDTARARGWQFDLDKLSRFFDTDIVEMVGHTGKGLGNLLGAIEATAALGRRRAPLRIAYGAEIEKELDCIADLVRQDQALPKELEARWLAVKLLEDDKDIVDKVSLPKLKAQIDSSAHLIEKQLGESAATAIAAARYGIISGACQEAVRSTIEMRHHSSDRIDAVLTNRILALPIFLALMYLVFQLTFTLGQAPMGWIEAGFGRLGEFVGGLWPEGSDAILKSLLVDGIIGGVGGVLVFLPNILLLFLAIAILEASGYMARVAFIMDRLMRKIGLHGKSFIPLLIGFGCSVPAIMATRTLDNRRDRLTTMLIAPLMSCGARLPIYALIIPAFFPEALQAPMLWSIYMIGIVLAVLLAKLLRSTLFKGKSVPFVMELPPYRLPTLRGVLTQMWQRAWLYLKKAGTTILAISVLLWALTTFPALPESDARRFELQRLAVTSDALPDEARDETLARIHNEETETALRSSFAGRIGQTMEPMLRPMGFDWKIGTALIGAFAAKEVFVAQLGVVYALGEADEESIPLREQLRERYTPLVGFCIMLFCLISAPCMATIAVTRRESGSWRWALLQLGGLTAIAWLLTTLVYQLGTLLGLGGG